MRYPLIEGVPDALVIHCADPRFQTAFRQFVREGLGVRMPMVLALPGVTSHFGMQAMLPKNWYALKVSIQTMTSRHDVARVILINHDDCKGYAKIAGHLGGLSKIGVAQKKHLHGLAEFVRKEFLPNAQFELYQAHIVGSEVEFEKIL
ncbi:MAG: hypothetical protein A3A96_00405 [Candidatus Zambryskibacteria bacterium RIFCSPLOWO2_01_FULL_39_39]|uniref:Carbonic anhydrase n=1 Tax=Candidatus Zambryskibacteria bacterium RIFCSPLOWO2_01_FULL_39_39 TaxID=1802758 RepID=A0A1G2TX73_9BACT|nr:MAG: hypothetical protein UT00_C0001G0021 [Parcubacteria group bacterium GW2011_GWA1_38_7]OHA87831.1 MAG: hypothetical protein A2644_01490 [Candidatus Zambryskibacteria bacterium RIFCSPHIGHO2_01_FULL_39_63]OHA94945.1 MAG: hypothetical protein A3B88_01025 [Candidatus Zambryskibacteria bacterium RIFCSPHIGHO2_02_FULL_39_19]OHA99125.1 MAG: hypothetical protein A3F20_02975 [Candidatus Zambryskibacteria bacterium RIFCSPHIGHO2_12_FULL_39_21]OHB01887.1 MAG: hypothetical protein A3A96_00405 [Candidat